MPRCSCLLAQSTLGAESQSVPSLPDPPPLVHYTVENPWPLVIGLAILSVVLFWLFITGRAGNRPWIIWTARVLVPVCVLLAVIAPYVKTERELLSERTDELVKRAAAADTGELSQMLAPEVSLRLLGGENRYSRERIMDLVRQYPGGKAPVNWHKIDRHQATMDGKDLARTQVHVRVKSKEATMFDFPVGSWWRIDWRRSNGEWKVAGLECMQIDGVPPGTHP